MGGLGYISCLGPSTLTPASPSVLCDLLYSVRVSARGDSLSLFVVRFIRSSVRVECCTASATENTENTAILSIITNRGNNMPPLANERAMTEVERVAYTARSSCIYALGRGRLHSSYYRQQYPVRFRVPELNRLSDRLTGATPYYNFNYCTYATETFRLDLVYCFINAIYRFKRL